MLFQLEKFFTFSLDFLYLSNEGTTRLVMIPLLKLTSQTVAPTCQWIRLMHGEVLGVRLIKRRTVRKGGFSFAINNKSPWLVGGFCALSYLYLNRLVINLLVVGTLEGIPHYAVPAYVLGSIVLQLNSNDFG